MAFNLAHLYPVTFDTKLEEMAAYLKGEDAHVYQPCQELGLEPVLQVIYNGRPVWSQRRARIGAMMGVLVENPYYDWEDSCYEKHLVEELGGIPVNLSNDTLAAYSDHWRDWDEGDPEADDKPGEVYEQLTWLTDFAESVNELGDVGPAYGNEPTVDYMYCSPCLVVQIDPASDRV